MSLPQLNPNVYSGQLFWLVINLLTVFIIIRFAVVPKMERYFFQPLINSEKMIGEMSRLDQKIAVMTKNNKKICCQIHQKLEDYKKDSILLLQKKFDQRILDLNASSTMTENIISQHPQILETQHETDVPILGAYCSIRRYLTKPEGYRS